MAARKAPRVGVIIAAGGRGIRMGRSTPKQFLRLGGSTILERSLRVFTRLQAVDDIVIVVPTGTLQRTRALVKRAGAKKVSAVVAGGFDRQESVWNGLHAFLSPPDIVLVHDAVRPLVAPPVVMQVIAEASRFGAAAVCVPVRDTIKAERRAGFSGGTLERAGLWAAQTPQGFSYELLLAAHRKARKERFRGTDEASLLERRGIPVRIVPGTSRNLKITTRDDLILASLLIGHR
jgi:2-C-methyl-D-erythritol 4-phosphate cytidylyltransferase